MNIIQYKGYRMIYDLHTHTIFSHGKGTIRDNVEAARKRGLSKIAISDHGPGHLTYGIKRSAVADMRREVRELNAEFDDIEVCLSVEANVINKGHGLDITWEEAPQYDFLIGGYHYGVTGGYCVRNFLGNKVWGNDVNTRKSYGSTMKSLMVKNTDMTLKAIYENELKILTHPGDKGPFDILELARACEKRGTLMEISTWHDHMTVEEIRQAAVSSDVKFIISSDAHHPLRVGDFQGGLDRAMEAGLDLERIVNIQKV